MVSTGDRQAVFVFRPFNSMYPVYMRFKILLGQLGLEGRLHDLRHTFASHLAMAGVPIPVISELLGHTDIATTMIYAHLAPDQERQLSKNSSFETKTAVSYLKIPKDTVAPGPYNPQ